MSAVGYFLEHKGWLYDRSTILVAKIVTKISLTRYMLGTIVNKFSAKELLRMIPDLRFLVISMLILMGIAFAVVHIFKIQDKHAGLFTSMFFISNTVFVGLPI